MEQPRDKEEALAGLLNGMMVTLLGGALPALFFWQVGQHWREIVAGDFGDAATDGAQGIGALVVSAFAVRYGIRMLRLNWAAFRRL